MTTLTPRSRTRLDGLAIVICLLSAATAVAHLYLGVVTTVMIRNDPAGTAAAGGATALGIFAGLFYLSCFGYVALTAALYHPATGSRRHLARWALISWTAGNLIAYFAWHRAISTPSAWPTRPANWP